jgi:hypothetical protein
MVTMLLESCHVPSVENCCTKCVPKISKKIETSVFSSGATQMSQIAVLFDLLEEILDISNPFEGFSNVSSPNLYLLHFDKKSLKNFDIL